MPHAGEMSGEQGPDAILDALDIGAKRIGHGILSVTPSERGREAIAKLKESQICCEVCPVSNVHLCDKCFHVRTFTFAEHPLPQMISEGIPCCINGDDPATFGAPSAHGLVREFQVCRDKMGLTDAQLAQLARNSFIHSFCPERVRAKALADIDAWESEPSHRGVRRCEPCR